MINNHMSRTYDAWEKNEYLNSLYASISKTQMKKTDYQNNNNVYFFTINKRIFLVFIVLIYV